MSERTPHRARSGRVEVEPAAHRIPDCGGLRALATRVWFASADIGLTATRCRGMTVMTRRPTPVAAATRASAGSRTRPRGTTWTRTKRSETKLPCPQHKYTASCPNAVQSRAGWPDAGVASAARRWGGGFRCCCECRAEEHGGHLSCPKLHRYIQTPAMHVSVPSSASHPPQSPQPSALEGGRTSNDGRGPPFRIVYRAWCLSACAGNGVSTRI